jgi:hypothetical protein
MNRDRDMPATTMKWIHRNRARLGGAFLMALLFAGCATGFFYNRLDTLASWYFEDLVSLTDDQRHELRDWLDRTLNWHRQSELHRYAQFVREISDQTATPGNRATYEAERARFDVFVKNLVDKTTPEASRLLLGLSREQTDEMLDSLADKARERKEKNAKLIASKKWQREQRDDITKQLKRWTGSVSPQQEEIIATIVAELEPTYLDWAASQQSWRDALRSALSTNHADLSTQQRIQGLLSDPTRQWTAPYAQKIARNRDRYLNMLAAIDASLSTAQRTRLREELRKLAGQLDQLAEGKE